jgi:hypothetical protein
VQVQLEGRGRENRSAGEVVQSGGCGIFLASEGILWATDYQGLLCMFEYMIEAYCLGFSWAGALGLSGCSGCENRRRGEVLGGRHA